MDGELQPHLDELLDAYGLTHLIASLAVLTYERSARDPNPANAHAWARVAARLSTLALDLRSFALFTK